MSEKISKLALTVFFALAFNASTALATPIKAQISQVSSSSTYMPLVQDKNSNYTYQVHKVNQQTQQSPEANKQEANKSIQTAAQALPEINKIGNAYSFTLNNGLQVVVLPQHRAPVITQMVWYRVGSADEPVGHTGIAHFLEHLMFKGTIKYPGNEFNQTVARLGGGQNAFTSYDYTAYYQSVAAQDIEETMKREADRMLNLVLSEDDIKSERQVIIEERRMRTDNSPAAMLLEETRATLFLNHPYHNPVIGWKQEMEALSRQDALDFYHRFYTPNNATLILSGDITPEKARDLAVSIYGPLQQRADPPQKRIRPQEPVSNTQRSVIMRDPRVSNESFMHSWVVPSYNNAKQGQAEALDLLGEILGGSLRSRLYTKLIVQENKAADIGSNYSGGSVDDGVFSIYGVPRDGVTRAELEQDVNKIIADIAKNGVSTTELNQARERFIRALVYAQDSPEGLANIYGSALSTGQTLQTINDWPERLKKVTPDDIKQMVKTYLELDKGVISYLLPPQDKAVTKRETAVNPSKTTNNHKKQ